MATTIKSDANFDHVNQAAPEYVEVVLWRRVFLALGILVAILLVAGWFMFQWLAGSSNQTLPVTAPVQPDLLAPPSAVPATTSGAATKSGPATSTVAVTPDTAPKSSPVSGQPQAQAIASEPVSPPAAVTPPVSTSGTPATTAADTTAVANHYKVKTDIFMPAVKRCVLTQRMHGREPATVLSTTDDLTGLKQFSLYLFTDVRGQAGDTLHYIWKRNGKVVAKVRIPVGSDKWRSYSSKNFNTRLLGNWEVDITDNKGRLMARTHFYLGD